MQQEVAGLDRIHGCVSVISLPVVSLSSFPLTLLSLCPLCVSPPVLKICSHADSLDPSPRTPSLSISLQVLMVLKMWISPA